jgi:hypothetical protein
MTAPKEKKKVANTVYSIRVGPKLPRGTLYVVGTHYPSKEGLPLPPIGTRVRVPGLFKRAVPDETGDCVVLAPGALVRLGPGPRTFGWPNSETGLAAARETASRIPGAKVIRVRDWRGGPM